MTSDDVGVAVGADAAADAAADAGADGAASHATAISSKATMPQRAILCRKRAILRCFGEA